MTDPRAARADLARPAAGHRLRAGQPAARDLLDRRAASRAPASGSATSSSTCGSPATRTCTATGSLNAFLARGPEDWRYLRVRLRSDLTDEAYRGVLRAVPRAGRRRHDAPADRGRRLRRLLQLPAARGEREPDVPAGRPGARRPTGAHLPIGYHGRAGTVQVSGTPVVRPSGQRKAPDEDAPTFGPSRRLDIEAEVGFVVGTPSRLGTPVPLGAFPEHVFGVCLVNDWSARDLQAWEYLPLGPFLGKSFLTSVSPWVVPLAALEAARVPAAGPRPGAAAVPARRRAPPWGLDLALEVRLNGEVISRPPFSTQYWTAAQQLAHLTVNGASLRTGDLYASGTVSGAGARPAGVAARAVVERRRAADAGRRLDPHLPRGRRRRHDHRDRTGRPTAAGSRSARSPAGSSPRASRSGAP